MNNKFKVLVTTTSFQDSPGEHHDLLNSMDWEIDYLRGPLKESDLIDIVGNYDGIICGDDEYTENVLTKGANGNLKCLSKYGVGLDKINLDSANKNRISVTNCPGINQVSVAEHVIALIFTFEKNIHLQHISTQKASWNRLVGREIRNKTIGIIGVGAIGKEISIIANNIGLNVLVYDVIKPDKFLNENKKITYVELNNLIEKSDYISLHIPLNNLTREIVNSSFFNKMKSDSLLINTARAGLVNKKDLENSLSKKEIRGYLCDVLDNEPIQIDEELLNYPNVLITPHVGSRTRDNIIKQGLMSVNNLKSCL